MNILYSPTLQTIQGIENGMEKYTRKRERGGEREKERERGREREREGGREREAHEFT